MIFCCKDRQCDHFDKLFIGIAELKIVNLNWQKQTNWRGAVYTYGYIRFSSCYILHMEFSYANLYTFFRAEVIRATKLLQLATKSDFYAC